MNTTTTVTMLPIDAIRPNDANPRSEIGDVSELAMSIASQGIQQALVVTPANQEGRHTLVIGHRRLAAAEQAGLATVPCIITDMDEQTQAEVMLVENIHRDQLTALDEARGYAHLLDLGEDVDQMAKATGRSRSTVQRRLKISSIDDEKILALPSQLSFEELETIADFRDDEGLQDQLIKAAGTNNWNMTLHQVQAKRSLDKWIEQAQEAIKQAGLPIVPLTPSQSWSDPEGWRTIARFSPDTDPDPKQALDTWLEEWEGDKPTAAGLLDRGGQWRVKITLLEPYTQQDQEDERRQREDDLARWQAEQEAEIAPAKQLDTASHDLRLAYTQRLMSLKRPAKNQSQALSMLVIAQASQRTWWVSRDQVRDTWRAIVQDQEAELAQKADLDESRRTQTAFALCHAIKETQINHETWRSQDDIDGLLKPLYRALQTAGYAISDEEQSGLDGDLVPRPEEEDNEGNEDETDDGDQEEDTKE